ncbi:C1QL [Mytilus coruscus]|uniref:C1QL n=1 Tax=Mytilus coruscus TaxID=42192 RepID=A0A6J8CNR5_MYTCO|nr:C1QL [Mytilus coruscus]
MIQTHISTCNIQSCKIHVILIHTNRHIISLDFCCCLLKYKDQEDEVVCDCDSNLGNELIDGLLDMILKIKRSGNSSDTTSTEIPAFSVSLTNAKDLGTSEIIKFDKVWTNNGNHYDPNTGIFQAHLNGVYQFSFTVMSKYGKHLEVYLWQNDTRLVAVYPGTGYNEGTANMVLNLKKGDRVYVKCGTASKCSLVEDILAMMFKFKGSDNYSYPKPKEIPAFSASLTNGKTLGATEIVQFDKVWTNNGKNYDPNTGIFKAPFKGVYQFSFTVMSRSGKDLLVFLWQNENRLVAVYPGIGSSEGTANMVLNLKKGDRVYVRCGGSGYGYINTSNVHWYSMFSGYLIHATK